ncbi:hypothetical protein BG004_006623 [Podila humilis]|nr:hypothetical protein BG004_006623 [Podila humilis]
MFDWVVISPEVQKKTRASFFRAFASAMQKSGYSGSVILLSHDGVNVEVGKEERPMMAELFEFEKRIFRINSLERVYILRVAMLQEQLLFAIADSTPFKFVLPIHLSVLNPIAVTDVVVCINNIIVGKAGGYIARRERWISTLTGPGAQLKDVTLSMETQGHPQEFCTDQRSFKYSQWMDKVNNGMYRVSLPLWPADAEAAVLREYLCWAAQSAAPARQTIGDWREIVQDRERHPLSVLLSFIQRNLYKL